MSVVYDYSPSVSGSSGQIQFSVRMLKVISVLRYLGGSNGVRGDNETKNLLWMEDCDDEDGDNVLNENEQFIHKHSSSQVGLPLERDDIL